MYCIVHWEGIFLTHASVLTTESGLTKLFESYEEAHSYADENLHNYVIVELD